MIGRCRARGNNMRSFAAVFAFFICNTCAFGQQSSMGNLADDHYCDDSMVRTLCLKMQAHLQETNKLLEQTQNVRDLRQQIENWQNLHSSDTTKQINGLVGTITDANSKLNHNSVSRAITTQTVGVIGKVSGQENTALNEVDRSMQDIFTPAEQLEIHRQMTHYAEQRAYDGKASTAQQSGSGTVTHATRVSTRRVPQAESSESPTSAFTSEEWKSINETMPREIVKQHREQKAAELAAAKQRAQQAFVAEQLRRKRAQQEAEWAKYILTHPQGQSVPVNDCDADQPSHPEACRASTQGSSDPR
jgi:hypothetical protein